jgi:molecular chaperone GrpE
MQKVFIVPTIEQGATTRMSDKKNEQHHHHKEHPKTPGEAKPEDQSKEKSESPKSPAAEAAVETEPPVDSLEDLKQKLETQRDQYLRLMAEFDNFKKRVSRDYERQIESANERLMLELIDVRDNLERAVIAGRQCDNAEALLDGMKLIFTKLNDVLVKNGLDPFGVTGELFDPQLHDALMKMPHEAIPEEHIAEVFEKGYTLKNRVIKHARVAVSSGAAAEEDGSNKKETAGC